MPAETEHRATSTRDRLIEATKQLVWERGIDATSPGAILKASRAGQGSMYHHFSGKPALVAAATASLAADLQAQTDAILADDAVTPLARVRAYLAKERDALRGCRLGRLAFDPARDAENGAPIEEYFTGLQRTLAELLEEAISEYALADDLHADAVAAAIVACIQGGYVVAAATGRASAMTDALDGLSRLLDHATQT